MDDLVSVAFLCSGQMPTPNKQISPKRRVGADSLNCKIFNLLGNCPKLFCHNISAFYSSLMLSMCLYKQFHEFKTRADHDGST
jgi:hypothetical protein